jgi:hypothetical protein
MLLGLTAFLLHVTNLDSSSAFQCMSNISRITCVQIFQVHQSECNGHHYVNHMVPLVHYIITVKVEMVTFVSVRHY